MRKLSRWIGVLVFVLLICMVCSSASFAFSIKDIVEEVTGVDTEEYQIIEEDGEASFKKVTVPLYLYALDNASDFPLYFVDGVSDLPFVNLSDWVDVMTKVYQYYECYDYELYLETDGDVALLTRENDYSMMVDFKDSSITFEDFDAFTNIPGENSLLDMVSTDSYDEDGNPILFDRIDRGSFDRYGKEIVLHLASYGIPLYYFEEDGLYLVPMQTLADFLLSDSFGVSVQYNGDAVFLGDVASFLGDGEELTPFGEEYYSAPYGEMSEDLAWYSYLELCLALDHLYGLKEIHDITSFDQLFQDTGYREDLCSTDPDVKDGALYDFIQYYLDDLHSGFIAQSFRTQEIASIGPGEGISSQQDDIIGEIYGSAREEADHTIGTYEEVGNTAYITFDQFDMEYGPSEYYGNDLEVEEDPASPYLDTISLILYAQKQINREDSPIENVVIDLSLNGGGAVDAAAFVCAWYLGEASLSVRSSLTGAVSTGKYRVDTNLDGKFNEEDTVSDRNLFCLISPYSFSCGNLVPNVFKSSRRVTLLGQVSGGGSCSILPISTAYGTFFQISSPNRMSYVKNGSYYDTDTGIEPDCFISKPENFYDRKALTEYINQLF